jgi:hypothetical protein
MFDCFTSKLTYRFPELFYLRSHVLKRLSSPLPPVVHGFDGIQRGGSNKVGRIGALSEGSLRDAGQLFSGQPNGES